MCNKGVLLVHLDNIIKQSMTSTPMIANNSIILQTPQLSDEYMGSR